MTMRVKKNRFANIFYLSILEYLLLEGRKENVNVKTTGDRQRSWDEHISLYISVRGQVNTLFNHLNINLQFKFHMNTNTAPLFFFE